MNKSISSGMLLLSVGHYEGYSEGTVFPSTSIVLSSRPLRRVENLLDMLSIKIATRNKPCSKKNF